MNNDTTLPLILNLVRRALSSAFDIKCTEETEPHRQFVITSLSRIRAEIRETAPQMWQVEIELRKIASGQAGHCQLPKEFETLPEMAPFVGQLLTCGTTGAIALDGEVLDPQLLRDALAELGGVVRPPVLYFGPYDSAGHYLCGAGGRHIREDEIKRLGFPVRGYGLALSESLDGHYCPGYRKGAGQFDRRTRPEAEGEAKLTHENGMTILGIWDRSVDHRGACNSTYIALGKYDYLAMVKLCEMTYGERWRKLTDRMPITLVETETVRP